MKSQLIEIDDVADTVSIQNVAKLLDEGALVAIPTDTVYGIACRVHGDSIARLSKIKGRDASKHYTVHIGSPGQLQKYVPRMTFQVRKLTHNGLPGPLTIVFEINQSCMAKLKDELGDEIFNLLYLDGTIGIRYPDHPISCEILSQTQFPVVAPSANPAGENPAVTFQEVMDYFPETIDFIISTPKQACRHKYNSTVIKAGTKGIELLRKGVIPEVVVRQMATVQILLVCTGNTCRSPMAEGIFRKHLANIYGCCIDELPQMGYKVLSCGITAFDGSPASEFSVIVCRENGIDIANHRSQSLSRKLISESDLIYTMTQNHYKMILEMMPEAEHKTMNLDPEKNISDPVGYDEDVYRQSFNEIQQAILKRIGQLL